VVAVGVEVESAPVEAVDMDKAVVVAVEALFVADWGSILMKMGVGCVCSESAATGEGAGEGDGFGVGNEGGKHKQLLLLTESCLGDWKDPAGSALDKTRGGLIYVPQ
jgi:hypothetical protein